jgi:ESS family glutamate:Na+ symporter
VICAAFSGIALGATPTAMTKLTTVTEKHGWARRAFIFVPLEAGFFGSSGKSVGKRRGFWKIEE